MASRCNANIMNFCYKFINSRYCLSSNLSRNSFTGSLWFTSQRGYARKPTLTDYNIVWNEPEKRPFHHPSKSGDLESFHQPDLSKPVVELQNAQDELKKCDELTQKVLSIEFGDKDAILNAAIYDSIRKVQRHQFDFSSREVKVAILTTKIRFFQEKLKTIELKASEVCALEFMVGKRNREVKLLRQECYKKFEWLLEQLNILYKPPDRLFTAITRKYALRKLIDMRYYAIREKRREEYKNKLELEKEPFLEEKLEVMNWIANTEKELGLPISVDVLEAEEQLRDYRQKELDQKQVE